MKGRNCRSAYLELAGAKLMEIQNKVQIVRMILTKELEKGNRADSEQLRRSRRQVECFMMAAQQKLEDLRTTNGDDWDTARDSFNSAWEDVAQSIKLAIAKFR